MTPVLHHESPRIPGSLDGHPAAQYGQPGDRCACGARLSSYNEHDACHRCLSDGAQAHRRARRAPASADGEAVTTAAPEPRRVTTQEVEMAAEERRKAKERKPRILQYLKEQDSWVTGTVLAEALDIPRGSILGLLGSMVGDGVLESRTPQAGGGYRLRQDAAVAVGCDNGPESAVKLQSEAEKCASVDEDAPQVAPATSPAPEAPVSSPELPASTAPEPVPAAEADAEAPAPAAGEEWPLEWHGMAVSALAAPVPFAGITTADPEVEAITMCVDHLRGLDEAACRRVLDYLACRFVVDKEA